MVLLLFTPALFNQEMWIHMTVKAVRHFLVHQRRMWFTMTFLTVRNTRMLPPVTEGAGKCLVFGRCLLHPFPFFRMAGNTECPWCCLGRGDLQWMMCGMTSQAVSGHLVRNMRLMTLGAVRNLAMDIMAEGT